ncbi:MAG TPA: hypothetical protein VEW42_00030 [Candidatus Eisenbacteria bacterium]|nr:hypothetical protein [Candidatus Eisenbacteria bacterium]
MKLDKKIITKFQKEILEWYEKNERDLPWRENRDPYGILISEVMSQQTQLSRVIPKYLEWMKRFPTLESLAKASTRDVLAYWSGLGYNRRALFLQRLAKILVYSSREQSESRSRFWTSQNDSSRPIRQAQGRHARTVIWPETEEELRKLPGIGEYTARALLCFAFNQQVAVVDTNVRKVILTQFGNVILEGVKRPIGSQKDSIASLQNDGKRIQGIADQLLPKGKAYEWNQALMDYAGAMLKDKKIPIPKQSHFKTSKRFYRGQIIRLLLKQKETLASLFDKIENNGITKEEFEKILNDMEKEGLIQRKGEKYWV